MRPRIIYKQRFNNFIVEDSFEHLLTKYRKANHFTMGELAEKIGITQSAISFYENPNVIKRINISQLIEFNNILYFDIFQGMSHLMYHVNKTDLRGIFLVPEITYEGKEINKSIFGKSLLGKGYSALVPAYQNISFGNLVSKKRLDAGMSQDELARFIHATPMTISRIENDKPQSIYPRRLSQLINILNLDPFESLFSLSENIPILSIELNSLIKSTRIIEIQGEKVPIAEIRKSAKEALIIL